MIQTKRHFQAKSATNSHAQRVSCNCSSALLVYTDIFCNDADTLLPVDVTKPVDESEPKKEVEEIEPNEQFVIVDDPECEGGEWVDADEVDAALEALKVS